MQQVTNRENAIRSMIKERMGQLKTLVPDKATQSRYASAITTIGMQAHLKNVDPASIVKTGFEIVQAGLNPNPLFGQAYVVPFKGQAQLQIGYKGWLILASRVGWSVRGVAVYDVDKFSIKFNGLSDAIDFEPNWDSRESDNGEWVYKHLKGVIVYAKHLSGMEISEFVPFKVLEKIRVKSQNQKPGKLQYIWADWAEEMYIAKALKRVITRLPIDDSTVLEIAAKEDEPIRAKGEDANEYVADIDEVITSAAAPALDCAKNTNEESRHEIVGNLIMEKVGGDVAAFKQFVIETLDWPADTELNGKWMEKLSDEELDILEGAAGGNG